LPRAAAEEFGLAKKMLKGSNHVAEKTFLGQRMRPMTSHCKTDERAASSRGQPNRRPLPAAGTVRVLRSCIEITRRHIDGRSLATFLAWMAMLPRMNALCRTYYYYPHDEPNKENFKPVTNCPVCGRVFQNAPVRPDRYLTCQNCKIVADRWAAADEDPAGDKSDRTVPNPIRSCPGSKLL
jgi:hypothetical protein